ncbi:MAG: hypothetical protein ACRECQ_08135, partial [Burkholderiaceae bacterium]
MRARLALARFESPLPAEWQAAIATFTASEQSRLARIERSLRREQFIAGHQVLRWLLAEIGVEEVRIEVEDGRLWLTSNAPLHVS